MRIISFNPSRNDRVYYLLLLLICLLVFWPLSFGVFSVKNDAIHYFLPYRFNISEAIRNGEMPFWSPYIYLGSPLYGDMQSGAWNPVVWLFSLIGRYDVTLLHFETLLYIFLAGAGMYKLTKRLVRHSQTAFLIATGYMLSGFMLSGQLINWLAAAAFFPFVLHYYLRTLNEAKFSNAVKTGITLFLLLTAGYPSFFIITVYLLLILFILNIIQRFQTSDLRSTWKNFGSQHLLVLLVFAGLSLPAIISFLDLLPYYRRGTGTSYTDAVKNSYEWQHLLSLIFPSTAGARDIISSTDITLRNSYPGIFTLLILVCYPPKMNRRNILLLLFALGALLFSLGDATPVRKLFYDFVPLMDTFRHPSQMRLFFIFSLLLLAAPGLKVFLGTVRLSKKTKSITLITIGLILAVAIIAFSKVTLLSNIAKAGNNGRTSIKYFFDNMTLADGIAVCGLIQLLCLLLFLLFYKRDPRKKIFSVLWVVNLFIMAQLVLPVSFVSQFSPREINSFIHASPKGFPEKDLENSLTENSKENLAHFEKIGLVTLYNKKIGISRISYSPTSLDEQDLFLRSNRLYDYVASKPVVYLADSVLSNADTLLLNNSATCRFALTDLPIVVADSCAAGNTSSIKTISANHFQIESLTYSASFLVLTQSYYHEWKAWIDGNKATIYKTNLGFMGIGLPKGTHLVEFRFIPSKTILATWIMLATLLLLIIVATYGFFKRNRKKVEA